MNNCWISLCDLSIQHYLEFHYKLSHFARTPFERETNIKDDCMANTEKEGPMFRKISQPEWSRRYAPHSAPQLSYYSVMKSGLLILRKAALEWMFSGEREGDSGTRKALHAMLPIKNR